MVASTAFIRNFLQYQESQRNRDRDRNLKPCIHDQEVNFPKSEMFFSRNVGIHDQQTIGTELGVSLVLGTGRYLGLPSMVGRGKKAVFGFIMDRLWKKINAWKSKNLSMAGREVLLKTVAQAIPSYCMSVYLLPHSLCDQL